MWLLTACHNTFAKKAVGLFRVFSRALHHAALFPNKLEDTAVDNLTRPLFASGGFEPASQTLALARMEKSSWPHGARHHPSPEVDGLPCPHGYAACIDPLHARRSEPKQLLEELPVI